MPVTSPAKVYPPIGRCIYCGNADAALTREHIVPFGLSGNLILPKASCRSCATITGRIEQSCLREMFGPTRTRLGMSTRRPKDRSSKLKLEVIADDESVQIELVPTAAHPATLVLAILQTPDILLGRPPVDGLRVIDAWWAMDSAAYTQLATLGAKRGVKGYQFGEFVPFKFGLMLAKIAHSYAAAVIGLDKLDSFLPEIILGRSKTLSSFIGGYKDIPPAELNILHRLDTFRVRANDHDYVTVKIRLFANLGAPTYQIIVGNYPQPQN